MKRHSRFRVLRLFDLQGLFFKLVFGAILERDWDRLHLIGINVIGAEKKYDRFSDSFLG